MGTWLSGDSDSMESCVQTCEIVSSRITALLPSQSNFVLGVNPLRLRAGVELEGRPVERFLEDGVGVGGVEEGELGVAEGCGGVFALEQLAIKRIHQRWRGSFTDFPESSDDVVGASTEEGPGEAYQTLARIGAGARAIAGGDGHQIGVQAVLNDIPGIELVGVTLFAEDHR